MLITGLLMANLSAKEPKLVPKNAKLVMITSSENLPKDTDSSLRPRGYLQGARLIFFLRGENFIRVKKDSLKAKGWELSSFGSSQSASFTIPPQKFNSVRISEADSLVRISEDLKQASFTFYKEGDFHDKIGSLKMKGELIMLTGGKLEKETATASTKRKTDIGPFKVQVNINKKNRLANGITITGNLTEIQSVFARVNGRMVKLLSGVHSLSKSDKSQIFNISKLTENTTEVQIEYWTDIKEQEVTFSK